jgi:hypothetical protein
MAKGILSQLSEQKRNPFRAARGLARSSSSDKHEGFAKRLAALKAPPFRAESSSRKVYEDEAGGSYKAGHPQRIARPATPRPSGPVGGERHQGEPMRRLRKAMANPVREPTTEAGKRLAKMARGG